MKPGDATGGNGRPGAAADGTRTVLVVDDDEDLRWMLVSALGALPGVRAVGAADGVEGLHRAGQLHPRVVLVDLVMPEMDGATLCRALRARAGGAVQVIAVSAADPGDDRGRALLEASDAWVGKPFDLADLLDRVRSHLDGADKLAV